MTALFRPLWAFCKRHARLFTCLFFAGVLLLGFFTTGGYGQPWDEPAEMNILRMNLWEFAKVVGADLSAFETRAAAERPLISDQMPTAFVPISQSVERDHGMAGYYPLFGLVMKDSLAPALMLQLWHGHTWLLFWLGAVALYGVCRRLGLSRALGWMAVLMLLLSPRFFAEGHYNNKDIVLFSFVLLTLWQALRLMQKPTFLTGLLFGLAGALAANTKIVGLALWGLCGLAVVVHLLLQKRFTRSARLTGLGSLLSFVLLYGLLTPALWPDPLAYLQYLLQNAMGFTRWSGYVLFRGSVFSVGQSPLPWYYLPYTILVTTPLWVFLLLGAGQWAALRSVFRKHSPLRVPLALLSLLWALPLLFAVVTRTSVYNGWRHFYFLYGPMLVLAAYGLSRLASHARSHALPRRLLAVLLCFCLLVTGVSMGLNHPYEYAYFSPLLAGRSINAFMERDYWNVSVLNVLRRLEQTAAVQRSAKPLAVAGVDLWSQVGLEQGMAVLQSSRLTAVEGKQESPDFWLCNPTYAAYSHWQPSPDMQPVVQVLAYGAPLMVVYSASGQ